MRRIPLLLLSLALAACGPRLVPLHELERFRGNVTIEFQEAGRPRVLTGELVSDRLSRNFQWVVRGATTASLSLLDTGVVNAFEDGRPRAATAAELADFAVVRALARPAKGQEPSVTGAGTKYRARAGGIEYTVSYDEAKTGHGHR